MLKIINLFIGMGLIAVLAFLLFGTISTDLTCIRSSAVIECSLVRNTALLKMSKIKILDPQAVDITTIERHGMKSAAFYHAAIRAVNSSHRIELSNVAEVEVDSTFLFTNQLIA
jgi:hypothetical protein